MPDQKNQSTIQLNDQEFQITRLFNVPRDLVFKAWTDPTHFTQWWGPQNFTGLHCNLDVRPGGSWRITMRSPDGIEYPIKGEFRQVTPPELLVMTIDLSEHPHDWHDLVNPTRDKTNPRPALNLLMTATFESQADRTRLTVKIRFDSNTLRDSMAKLGMGQGWSQSLDRLDLLLSNAMPNEDQHPACADGKICYIDIPAVDINLSSTFYQKVFGWHVRTRGDGHLAFDDTLGQVSGTWTTNRPPSTSPGLLIYIMVKDAPQTLEAIKAAGGKITQPSNKDAPEITARFTDPAGNVLGIYHQRGM
jgi:uncharacterized protein YndB with AHSA1/START domain/predicted enzyme related to lactoylglutathione lyase